MLGQATSEIVNALSAEREALLKLKPIYEAEKIALIRNEPNVLVELSASKAQALQELRAAIDTRESACASAGIVKGNANAAMLIVKSSDVSVQRLWQDIRTMTHALSVLHRVVAGLLKHRQTTLERALAVLMTSRSDKGLYDQSGNPLGIAHSRSGIAI
jgi:flagellar biosynthesis/type III secretory pathway chaperone